MTTYKEAGVDIDKGNELVGRIAREVKNTFTKGVLGGLGGFGGFFELETSKYQRPVLVSSCDGVGTKLKVASQLDRHDTIGIDLVAMCVNDTVTSGARPLFFLDYLAMGKLDTEIASQLVGGIAAGCREAGCALIGGETAEMPGVYQKSEYDLAGFCVGVVEHGKIIDGKGIVPGDVLIGLTSNGLHSNGYSLVRKLLEGQIEAHEDELLKPTRIYVKPILSLLENIEVKGIAHITGGGFIDNIPRILPDGMQVLIKEVSWEIPSIFRLLEERGNISRQEMYRTFNMGIGLVVIASREVGASCLDLLGELGEKPCIVGTVEKGKKGVVIIEG